MRNIKHMSCLNLYSCSWYDEPASRAVAPKLVDAGTENCRFFRSENEVLSTKCSKLPSPVSKKLAEPFEVAVHILGIYTECAVHKSYFQIVIVNFKCGY